MRRILLYLIFFRVGSLLVLAGTSKSAAATTRSISTDFATRTATSTVDPPPVPLNARQIAAGGDETCALTTTGAAMCWGVNDHSQLGDGTTTNKPWPTEVQGLTGALMIQPGWYHTCAITTGGRLQCWGWNAAGQLGGGTTIDHLTPNDVLNLSDGVRSVAAGWFHSCAVTALGGARCWATTRPASWEMARLQID